MSRSTKIMRNRRSFAFAINPAACTFHVGGAPDSRGSAAIRPSYAMLPSAPTNLSVLNNCEVGLRLINPSRAVSRIRP